MTTTARHAEQPAACRSQLVLGALIVRNVLVRTALIGAA